MISIVGRFLEHSRAFYFLNGGDEEVYIGSADWMPRNLERRIEAVTPIEDPAHRQTLRDLLLLHVAGQPPGVGAPARRDATSSAARPVRRPSGRRHRMLVERIQAGAELSAASVRAAPPTRRTS